MQEKTSAFIDGELSDAELDALLAELDQDASLENACGDYQLISDAMNQRPLLGNDFMAKFSERLAAEPTVIAPGRLKSRLTPPRKRLVALSMAASVALVSATVWYGAQRPEQAVATMAEIVPATAPAQGNGAMAYMVAHRAAMGNPLPNRRAVILTGAESERINPVPVAIESKH